MCINLVPNNAPPGTEGRWFMVSGPANFSGSIHVSCDGNAPWVLEAGYPSNTKPLGVDAGCTDLADIWILPGGCQGTFHFKFVTPVDKDLSDCGGGDCEVSCSDFILHVNGIPSLGEVEEEVCTTGPSQNLFTLGQVSCVYWDVDYKVGSPEDPDFDLSSACNAGYGDFNPIDITPGTYIFVFSPKLGVLCSDCQVELTLIVEDAPFTGYDCEESVCIVL